MQFLTRIKPSEYHDSITLMQVAAALLDMPGIEDAAVVMGTPANRELVDAAGLLTPEFAAARPDDLVIVVKAADDAAGRAALAKAEEILGRRAERTETTAVRPKSLASAIAADGQANLAVISVAGRYAAEEARTALEAGLHVLLFSDNVSLEDEIALKDLASRRRLLCMGPDAGTAIINGVALGFEIHGATVSTAEPAVLLMPTWTIIHARFWKFQVPYLARHHRVIVYDGPGNGTSDRVTDPNRYGVAGLLLTLLAVRFLGFGSMQLVSNNVIAQWFVRRRGMVMGLASQSLAVSLFVFPALAEMLIRQFTWRGARQRARLAEQAELLRSQGERLRQRAVLEERLRIARELHDVVAHHVSVIGIQAGAARKVLARDPDAAARALTEVERSSREAVTQMRGLLGTLRAVDGEDDPQRQDRSPEPGLADLPALVDSHRVPGFTVSHQLVESPEGTAARVPAPVALTLYRTAQEALANVRRHSTARRVGVVLRVTAAPAGGYAEIEVVDDGRPRGGTSGSGLGLLGIRERVASHRGEVEIGPRGTGGYRVRVRLPLPQGPAEPEPAGAADREGDAG